jgi:protein phosphatase
LIELALRGGGPDNVTCIVADVVDAGQAGDDLPVVGGAVVDPSAAPAPAGPDSPAMRASRIGAEEPLPATLAPRRRSRRRWLLGLLAAAVLIGGAIGGYAWTQSQFFVGRDGTEVALFHGINADFGPFSLYSVVENTDLKVNDLQPAARSQVANGIAARDRQDGDRILARLSDQLLPPCPTVTPTPTVSPPTATATRKAPLPVRTSTGRAVPRPTATAATRSAIPSLSATLSAPGVTPSPSLSPAECRS